MSLHDVAARSGVDVALLGALEAGADWVDRRRVVNALAAALGSEPVEFVGRPYPPRGPQEAVVRGAAQRVRRALARTGTPTGREGADEAAALLAAAERAERDADDAAAARVLPRLVGQWVAAPGEVPEGADCGRALLLASRLMRRVGFVDLAWLLVDQARRQPDAAGAVLADEVRLLAEVGFVDLALLRVSAGGQGAEACEPLLAAAWCRAVSGAAVQADAALVAAAAAATRDEHDEVVLVRAECALELGHPEEAAELLGDPCEVGESGRSVVVRRCTLAGLAAGRLGRYHACADALEQAFALAPLRAGADPYVRELLAVVPGLIGRSGAGARLAALGDDLGSA